MVNVCYATNDDFFTLVTVSISSLFENYTSSEELTIYILCDNVSKENKDSISSLIGATSFKVVLIDIEEQIKYLRTYSPPQWRGTNSLTTWARIFLPELLPLSVNKALYLDGDTVVNKDITSLYQSGLDGHPLGAVSDCLDITYRKVINYDMDELYFNAGVLLIDLDLWRKNGIQKKLLDLYVSGGSNYLLADQDLLNMYFRGDVALLPLAGNYLSWYRVFSPMNLRKYLGLKRLAYSDEDILSAKDNAIIIHFNQSFKVRPWFSDCNDPCADIWERYACTNYDFEAFNTSSKTYRDRLYDLLPEPIAARTLNFVINAVYYLRRLKK